MINIQRCVEGEINVDEKSYQYAKGSIFKRYTSERMRGKGYKMIRRQDDQNIRCGRQKKTICGQKSYQCGRGV
jgi:hypothetical protein